MLRVDDYTCPAGASDLRREDLAPRASRHDRGGTEFLFFNSGPCRGARFFLSENKILPYDAAELTILFLAASQLAMVLLK
jgi:hypothetical protein